MTAFATNVVPNVGLADTGLFAAATASDTAPCGPGTFLVVKNAGGSPMTVTVACPAKVDGRLTTTSSTSPSIPATTGVAYIPLPTYYADPVTGLATITYSSTTSVTVAVVRVP